MKINYKEASTFCTEFEDYTTKVLDLVFEPGASLLATTITINIRDLQQQPQQPVPPIVNQYVMNVICDCYRKGSTPESCATQLISSLRKN